MSDMNIEEIVKKVLESMNGAPASSAAVSAPASNGAIPATAKVAMLTGLEKVEIK